MTYEFIVLVLILHWIFDFVLQSEKMALNKSKHFGYLCEHCAVYSLWGLMIGLPFNIAITFILFLYISHLFVDGITSKITAKLWEMKEVHYFFVVIGLDQFIHYATIFYVLNMLLC